MANTSSARKRAGLKALRTDAKRATRNAASAGAIEVQERQMRKALAAKDADAMARIQKALQKLYDKAAKNNVMHRKTADRRKSRLAARIVKAQ